MIMTTHAQPLPSSSNRRHLCVLIGGLFTFALFLIANVSPAEAQATAPAAAAASPTANNDLVAVAQASGNFKTFLKAAEAAGLLDTLRKAGPYTLFAPTDAAFSKLPAGMLDDLLKSENKAKLVATVSYHIATGRYSTAELTKVDEVKTLQGTELDVETSTDGKVIEIDEAKILGVEVVAANGVLHSIDTVLQP